MSSYWIDSIKGEKKKFESLKNDEKADVCVIGGGLTGVTTAYYLQKAGLDVILLEKYKICEHTSRKYNSKNY